MVNKLTYSFLLPLLIAVHVNSIAQEFPKREYDLEKLADELFPQQDLDLNYEELYENLAQILANPVDLNNATVEELRSLLILSAKQIDELIQYRSANGTMLSVYELQSLRSFDSNTLYRLMPFVQVGRQDAAGNLIHRILNEKNNYFITRYERTLENKRGFTSETDSASRYLGSPDKIYARFRVSRSGDFSLGFTVEKDAGETVEWTSQRRGFDYYSAHAQAMNQGKIKNVIVGDYQAQFGQGLALGGGFGTGKGAETITTLRKGNIGFIPYASLNEYGFFRGAAISIEPAKNFFVNGFFSSLHRDGSLKQDSVEDAYISSFMLSGFHRSASEMNARKQIGELNFGAGAEYRRSSFLAGGLIHQTRFEVPVFKNTSLYNQFVFEGAWNTNVSLYMNYSVSNFAFFGEVAQSIGSGSAFIAGVLGSLSQNLDMSLLYRNYARNYYTFYGNALSENTSPQNESGIYWGWKYLFGKKTSTTGYVDLFRFPWLRFRGYAPSDGSEWLLRFNHKPTKTVSLFLQAREERKIRNMESTDVTYQTSIGTKRSFWVNADYSTGRLGFKSRVQYSRYHLSSTTQGLAIIQDISVNLGKLSVSSRYALFDTDDYDNRQYVYEKDMWLAFSFPAYNGVGIRNFVLLEYKLTRKIDFWIRWAHTTYKDVEAIGSGSETISGNSKTDLKVQVRIKL